MSAALREVDKELAQTFIDESIDVAEIDEESIADFDKSDIRFCVAKTNAGGGFAVEGDGGVVSLSV